MTPELDKQVARIRELLPKIKPEVRTIYGAAGLEDNAEYLTLACSVMPALLEELDRLKARLATVKECCDIYSDDLDDFYDRVVAALVNENNNIPLDLGEGKLK